VDVNFRDSRGHLQTIPVPPRRIVSLVPSLTETLCALGRADALVGVTEYCVHPAEMLGDKARVGGTKNPALETIVALRPDLVLANHEENRRRDVERLEAAGVRVLVTYARTVADAVDEIAMLGRLLASAGEAAAITSAIGEAWTRVRARPNPDPPNVAALIWKAPYMVVGPDTFAHDLIEQCGGRNAFAAQGERRYPRTDPQGLVAARPDVILLPTEPYAFGPRDRDELLELDLPAARSGRVHVIEGELLTWYGPRIERALEVLSALF